MSFHNFCQPWQTPRGLQRILGLGLKFCVKKPMPTRDLSFERFESSVRRQVYFASPRPESSPQQIQEEYVEPMFRIPSGWNPDPGQDPAVEQALSKFKNAVIQKRSRYMKPTVSNLRPSQLKTIKTLKNHDDIIIIAADKNLGACAMPRDEYIRRAIDEHLSNRNVYKLLDEDTAKNYASVISAQIRHFACRHAKAIGTDQRIWLIHQANLRVELSLPKFRMTAKVHKNPLKMRPIVCCAGTLLNGLSEWLDWQLGKLLHLVPSYLKNSYQLLDELNNLGPLPPSIKVTTADATAMYTNMDTTHLIEVMTWWLNKMESEGKLPFAFPLEAVVEAIRLVMENNVFVFGDCHYLQISGSAMGTSSACKLSTLYFHVHEDYLMITYVENIHYLRRFIDDQILLWKDDENHEHGIVTRYEEFKRDLNNFGVLKWEAEDLGNSANFLDITITISAGSITTKTYQKALNKYQYITPYSSHPKTMTRGIIYGFMRTYYLQNTSRSDYKRMATLLFERHVARGWDRTTIRDYILDADRRLRLNPPQLNAEATTNNDTQPVYNNDRLFFHLGFHEEDIPSRLIQRLYKSHCAELFKATLGIDRLVIAYSRPRNISELCTKAKLHQVPGREVSKYVRGEI